MMLRPQGYATITCEQDNIKREADTFSCGHCNAIRHVKAKQRAEDIGGLCKCCMKLICEKCVGEGVCSPLMKKIEQLEERAFRLREYGRL